MEESVVTLPLRQNTPLKYTSRRSESLEWPLASLKIFDANGEETDRVIYLYAGTAYLGRSVSECTVVLEGLASISNRHVQFEVDSLGDGQVSCSITDCKSLNKTYVYSGTDVRALSPYVPSPLRDGDIVRLGHLKMAYSVIRGLNRLRLPRKTALGRQKLVLPEEQFAPKTPQPSPVKRTERPSRVPTVDRERKNEDEPVTIQEHPSRIPTIILDREPATQRLPVPENSPPTSEPQPGPSRALPSKQPQILDDEDDDYFPMSQAVDMRAPTPPRHMLLNGPRQSTIAETPETPPKTQREKIVVPLYDGDGNEMPPTTFSQLGGISYSLLSQEAREAANGGAGGEGDDVISGQPSEFFTPANELDADDDIYIAETQMPSPPVVYAVESSDDDEPDDILTPMPIRRVEKRGNGHPNGENKENVEDSDQSYPLQIPENSDSETSVRRVRVGEEINRFEDSQMETQAAPLASHANSGSQFETQAAPLIHLDSNAESDDGELEDSQMAVQTQYAPVVRASLAKLKLDEEDSQEIEPSDGSGNQGPTVDEDKFEDSQEQFETQAAPVRPMEDSQMQTQAAPVRRDEDEDSEDDVQTQAVRLDDEEDFQIEEKSDPEKKLQDGSMEDSQLETQAASLRPIEDPEEFMLTQVAPGFDEDSQEEAMTQAAPLAGVEELEMAEMPRGSEDSASLQEESERDIEMAETQVAPVRKGHMEDSQLQTQAAPLRPTFDEDEDDDLTQAEEASAHLEDSQLQTQAAPLRPTFDEDDDDEDLTQAAPVDDLDNLEMAETQVAPVRRPRNSYLEDSQLQTQAAPLRPTSDEDDDDEEEMAETQAAPVRRDHQAGNADLEDSQLQTQAAPLRPTFDEDDDFFTPALRLDDEEEMAETQFAPLPSGSTEDSQLETQAAPLFPVHDEDLAETQPAENLEDSQEFMATQAAPLRFSLDDSSEDVLTQAERILKDPHFLAMEELPETRFAQLSSEDEETQVAPAFDVSPAPLRSSMSSSVRDGNRLRKSVRFDNSAGEIEEISEEHRRSFEESRKREEVGVTPGNPSEDSDEETVDPVVVVAEGPLMAGNAEPEELSPVVDYGCADDAVSESSNDLDYGIDFSEDVARLAAQSVALGSSDLGGNEDPFDVDTQPAEPLITSSPPLVRKSSSTNSQLSQCSQVGLGTPFRVPQAFACCYSQSDICTPQELPHHDEEDEDVSRNAVLDKSPIKRNLFGTSSVKQEDLGDVREYHRVSPQPVTIDIDDDDIDLEAAANIDSQTLSRFMASSPNRSLAQQEESRPEPKQTQEEEQPPTAVVVPSKQGIPSVHELKECSVVLTRCDSAAFLHPPTGNPEGSGVEMGRSQRTRPAAALKKEDEPVPGPSTSVTVPSRRGRKPAQIKSNEVRDISVEQKKESNTASVAPRRGNRGMKKAETTQQPPKPSGRPKKAVEKKQDQPVPDQQEENASAQVPLPVAKNVRQNRQELKEIAEKAAVNLAALKRERMSQDAENPPQEQPGPSAVVVRGRKGHKNAAAPAVKQGSSSSAATNTVQPARGRPIKRERQTEQERTPAPEVPTRRRPQRRAAAAANVKMEEWTQPRKHSRSRPSSPAHSEASTTSSRSRSVTDRRRQAASPVPSEGRASSVGSRGVSPAGSSSRPRAQKRGKKEEAQEKPVSRKRARGNAQQQKAQQEEVQEQVAEQQEQTAGEHQQQEEAPTRKRGRQNVQQRTDQQEEQVTEEQITLNQKHQEELQHNKGPGGKQGRRVVNKKTAKEERHPSEPQEGTSSEQGEASSGRHGRKNVNRKQEEEQKETMPTRRGQRNINRRAAQQQQEEEQQQELMPPPARPGKAQVKKEGASQQKAQQREEEPVASTSSSSPVKRTAASRGRPKAAPVSKKARMKHQETVEEEAVNTQANSSSRPRYSRVLTSVAPKFRPKCKSVVESLGGRIVGEEELESGEFDVLIVDNFRPTVEILSAVSLGLPVVGREWITECAQQKAFVEPWQYIVRCAANERHYRAQLEESIVLAQSRREAHDRLLFSFKFFIDLEVENPPADKYHIFLTHAGASSVTELSARPRIPRDGTAVIVVPTDDVGTKADDPRFKDAKIVSADDVLGAILRQHAPFLES